MSKAKDIVNGWKNYFFGNDVADEETITKRVNICASCPTSVHQSHTALLPDLKFGQIEGMVCSKELGGCGCPLSPAVRSIDYKCIKGKW